MLIITIKVVPNAKQPKIIFGTDERIKCYLTSAPEHGKANKELVQMLAKRLKIPRGAIEIVKGLTTRTKQIRIDTALSYQEFLDALGIEVPGSLLS